MTASSPPIDDSAVLSALSDIYRAADCLALVMDIAGRAGTKAGRAHEAHILEAVTMILVRSVRSHSDDLALTYAAELCPMVNGRPAVGSLAYDVARGLILAIDAAPTPVATLARQIRSTPGFDPSSDKTYVSIAWAMLGRGIESAIAQALAHDAYTPIRASIPDPLEPAQPARLSALILYSDGLALWSETEYAPALQFRVTQLTDAV